MAGVSHTNSTFEKSAASARKSRWETSSSSTAAINKPTSYSKSNDQKPQVKPHPFNSNPNPSPKPNISGSNKPTTPINNNAIPTPTRGGPTFPFRDTVAPPPPPPPPTYGFHMLERRTIALADGSVRSYFALPPDYQDFPLRRPPIFPRFPHPGGGSRFPPMGPEMPGLGFPDNNINNRSKRKFGGEEEFRYNYSNTYDNQNGIHHPDHFTAGTSTSANNFGDDSSRAGKHMKIGDHTMRPININSSSNKHLEVDQVKLKKAFLHFAKLINETEAERKRYLENGKQGRLLCIACGRSSKEFPDTHALVMHTYNSDNADMRVDHLGLHKALCVLMGWNYSKPPDNAKLYHLPADEAAANQNDLIMWFPLVIIHNTITGRGKDGRMEGLGNRAMDNKLRELGFPGGKSKSLYGREGHLGTTLIKFSGDLLGLNEALRLAEYFEKENHGRRAWERMQPVTLGKDDEKNPNLVTIDPSGEKKRILYGYLGTAADLCKVDFETRKKVTIESKREHKESK